MSTFSISTYTATVLAEKVREVQDIPENTQEGGKLYAYTQAAIALMESKTDGITPFIREIQKKKTVLGWNERPWMRAFDMAHDRHLRRQIEETENKAPPKNKIYHGPFGM